MSKVNVVLEIALDPYFTDFKKNPSFFGSILKIVGCFFFGGGWERFLMRNVFFKWVPYFELFSFKPFFLKKNAFFLFGVPLKKEASLKSSNPNLKVAEPLLQKKGFRLQNLTV
jgi:hypothetical protein